MSKPSESKQENSFMMNIHPDFEELLRLLEERRVDYMIVGGYAVAFHGHPRFTKDLDICFDCNDENIERLKKALVAFGFSGQDLLAADFSTRGNIITFGVPPIRVDLIKTLAAYLLTMQN